ncbi:MULTISPECIES: TetR/AcrR family transcriptional regulator [Streptomyces]|uniref:TetR/AcrR family transcriptional regulator n=1 Tax=Streptomyces lonegramiae TaxID=3075524 RepID=A0ABU2XUA2_9ACTN|nr:TetR/AcrR family transcriptional regulator [Streptomyces sp. DSM 41529]MDT0549502.1 TetR/AcrR family transcriptional regulator [Streptomyces sp. DSM 41529]
MSTPAPPPTPSHTPAPGCSGARLPGRPRSAAADAAIIEAALRLIEEGATIGELSIEGIAREAGVGKATLYRRWSGKDALMIDVLRSLEEPSPRPDGVSVRDDLVTILELMRRRGLAKRNSALLRTVLTQMHANQKLWRTYDEHVIAARREVLREVLRRGVASGEIRDDLDIDLLADLFTGPMLARAILQEWKALPEGLAESIVDTVLEGVRPRA